jgi:hypothetical protein
VVEEFVMVEEWLVREEEEIVTWEKERGKEKENFYDFFL